MHELSEVNHRILNPFTESKLETLAAIAGVGPSSRILDLACGKGELLCQWARRHGSAGLGIDISEVFLPAAARRAEELGVTDRVAFRRADAADYQPRDGVFSIGACIGATWIGNGVAGTIELLRPAVAPDGLLLIGEPFWREDPPAGAVEQMGFQPGEFADLAGLLGRFEAAGTDLVELVTADEDSWDRYAAGQWWALRQWLDTHSDSPLAAEVRDFYHRGRRSYLAYQRRYLGWGVFVLRLSPS